MLDEHPADLDEMAKSWSIAMKFARKRLKRIHGVDDGQLDAMASEGLVTLETLCLFVHSAVKTRQYLIPPKFWHVLHCVYGITVYPSALTECIDVHGVGTDCTFAEAYGDHIVMMQRRGGGVRDLPPSPFDYLQQAPPAYHEICGAR